MLTNTDFKFNFSLQVQMKYINIKNNDQHFLCKYFEINQLKRETL